MLRLANRVEPLAGLRAEGAQVIQYLRDQTGAAVSLVVPTGHAFVALEMIPGRDDLPIDAHAGADMPATTAAALALRPAGRALRRTESARTRPFRGAVDQEHVLPGLTCYAAAVLLPGGQRVSLQIATPASRPAERYAAAVHRAGIDLQAALKSADLSADLSAERTDSSVHRRPPQSGPLIPDDRNGTEIRCQTRRSP